MARGLLGSLRELTIGEPPSQETAGPASQVTPRVRGPHFRSPLLVSERTAERLSCIWAGSWGQRQQDPPEGGGNLVNPLHACGHPEKLLPCCDPEGSRARRGLQCGWGRLRCSHGRKVIRASVPAPVKTNVSHPRSDLSSTDSCPEAMSASGISCVTQSVPGPPLTAAVDGAVSPTGSAIALRRCCVTYLTWSHARPLSLPARAPPLLWDGMPKPSHSVPMHNPEL